MLAPLAVSPVFLYAWTGEMRYIGRWAFVALTIGAMASVLSFPAVTLMQAAGRPGIQGRVAAISILVNIPLSLVLVAKWGSIGAAIGTGIAMIFAAVHLLGAVHEYFNKPMGVTIRLLAQFWPMLLVCLCWGALTYVLFSAWFATLDPAVRFSRSTRVYPGFLAALVYVMCLISMLLVELRRGAFTVEERAFLAWLIRFRWFAKLTARGREG